MDFHPGVERPAQPDPAQPFEQMAGHIRHNAALPFAGAAVIVPPAGAGDPVSTLVLDPAPDAAQFWADLLTKVQGMVAQMQAKAQQQQGFGHY